MKIKTLYICGIMAALLSCSDSHDLDSPYLNGEGKTPVSVSALLDIEGGSSKTRAANKDFASADRLLVYMRHVTWDGNVDGERQVVTADKSPSLVVLTKGSDACTDYSGEDITPIGTPSKPLGLSSTNTRVASDLTPTIYWDDFSTNASDLRTTGHYLQSYYGYCFNGGEGAGNETGSLQQGNIAEALAPTTGVLGWSVPYDQDTDADALRHADLLWSAEQTPVSYTHGDANVGGQHGTLLLPFTHAMSMVTVVLTAGDGFDATAFDDTWLELQGVMRVGKISAPDYNISGVGQGTDNVGRVKMKKHTPNTEAGKTTCTWQAIVMPQTMLTLTNTLLRICNADDNDYEVKVTDALIGESGGWTDGLEEGNKMKPGYNYLLKVTVSKAGVSVRATVTDWITLYAEGVGKIQFENDITHTEDITYASLRSGGIDIYKSSTREFSSVSTYMLWDEVSGKWTYHDPIYWAGQGDASFFRAVSPHGITPGELTQGESIAHDVLWGYGCDKEEDKAKVGTGDEVPLTPRTGNVPLHFAHAMSKITVKLATNAGDDAVTLDGAAVSVSNLATTGVLDMVTGRVTPGALTVDAMSDCCAENYRVESKTCLDNYCVIPQGITNDAVVSVKLSDGTVYKLALNTCVDSGSNPITTWQQGKHYIYTITLTKGAVTLRALVENWVDATGNGNAELDWD